MSDKKQWICTITKTFKTEDGYQSEAHAIETFINDIARNNFDIVTEEYKL